MVTSCFLVTPRSGWVPPSSELRKTHPRKEGVRPSSVSFVPGPRLGASPGQVLPSWWRPSSLNNAREWASYGHTSYPESGAERRRNEGGGKRPRGTNHLLDSSSPQSGRQGDLVASPGDLHEALPDFLLSTSCPWGCSRHAKWVPGPSEWGVPPSPAPLSLQPCVHSSRKGHGE